MNHNIINLSDFNYQRTPDIPRIITDNTLINIGQLKIWSDYSITNGSNVDILLTFTCIVNSFMRGTQSLAFIIYDNTADRIPQGQLIPNSCQFTLDANATLIIKRNNTSEIIIK